MNSDSNNLRAKVVRGGLWIVLGMIATHLLNLVVMGILARVLTPAEFGVVALAMVIGQFITLLATHGATQYVIYDNLPGREERVQAAFWMDLFVTVSLVMVGFAVIPVITRFYNQETLDLILFAILASFPLKSFTKVFDALLKKNLEFKKLEIRDSVVQLTTAFLAVAMALTGYGVWSLVIPGMVAALVRVVIVLQLTPWRPKLEFNFILWPKIFKFYGNIMGNAVTSQVVTDGDTVLVGKIFGASQLGLYNLAYQSANLINRTVVAIGNKLALPSLATVANDPVRTRSVLVALLKVTATFSFPLFVGLFVVADDFILLIYGEQWAEAILPFRILLVYAMRYALSPPIGAFFHAIGKPQVHFRLGLLNVPCYLAAIYVGSRFGIAGVALGVTVVRTLFGLVGFEITARYLGIKFADLISPLLPALCASMLMGAAAFSVKLFHDTYLQFGNFAELLIVVAAGCVTYILLLRMCFREMARDIVLFVGQVARRFQPFAALILHTN